MDRGDAGQEHRQREDRTSGRRRGPAQEVEVALRLSDDAGKPLAGEATFWMVDQAVLSLAKERPLDPLPDFIVERETKMAARDTRNMAFGVIPLEEIAGGDGDDCRNGAPRTISPCARISRPCRSICRA